MGSTKDICAWRHQHWQVNLSISSNQSGSCTPCQSESSNLLLIPFAGLHLPFIDRFIVCTFAAVVARGGSFWLAACKCWLCLHACSGRQSLTASFADMESHNVDRTSLYPILSESRSVSGFCSTSKACLDSRMYSFESAKTFKHSPWRHETLSSH